MHSHPMCAFLADRLRRSLLASFGLVIFSFAAYLQLVANFGLPPWQALNEGLSSHLHITIGNVSIILSILIVVTDVLMKEPIGLGTILDAFIFGWALDFFLWLDLIPYQTALIPQLAVTFLSIVTAAVSQYVYMKAALSCGPRDALLVALGKRFPKVSIGTVNTGILVTVLIAGFLLGGTVGIGTLVHLLATGPIIDLVFKALRFEPRSIDHEGLTETARAFLSAANSHSTH